MKKNIVGAFLFTEGVLNTNAVANQQKLHALKLLAAQGMANQDDAGLQSKEQNKKDDELLLAMTNDTRRTKSIKQ
ncbi:MAG: hypothetical protein WC069_03135 [Candidatus Shapirobacteria bacterium]